MALLWLYPHWETMQVFWIHSAIPLWLILLWFVTNITNAIAAYLICWELIKRGRTYEAHLQWIIGYFIFFFILIYGWDGTGWQRFTWDATVMLVPWTPGATMGLAWLGSNVAITLYILGAVFLPPYFYFATKWAVDGLRADPEMKDKVAKEGIMPHIRVSLLALIGVGLTFLLALASAALGWAFIALTGSPLLGLVLGIAIVAIATYFLGIRKGMPIHKLFDKFINPK
ncbi:MAG TPA: hypothetical protein VMV49_00775 [Candidatus Deferrimicrobium sp.]|nr:hypothetical protein [Candidatus Deferrimicrobium sp.]